MDIMDRSFILSQKLFCNLGNNACAYGSAAFTDCETLSFFHRYRGNEFYAHFNVEIGRASCRERV